jgi:hypothetical protein
MRHSDIATTYNVYGGAMSHEKREANHKVVNLLLSNSKDEADTTDGRRVEPRRRILTYAPPSCHSRSLVGLNRHRLPTRREGILPAAAISRSVFGWHFRIFAASCSVSIWFTCICLLFL